MSSSQRVRAPQARSFIHQLLAGSIRALLVAACLTACVELPTTPAPSAREFDPSFEVSAITAGASLSQEYSWSQGLAPTSMGSTYQRSCFLVFIGGTWDESADSVQ